MGKLIATFTLVVLAFMAALIVPLALSGKLNKESIDTIMGKDSNAIQEPIDPAGPLMQSLEEEQERLATKDAELTKRDELLTLREAEVSATLNEIKTIQAEITQAMDTLDEEKQTRLTNLAKTLGTMKADNAAKSLEEMTPEQASLLLPMISEKNRGKILDSMDDEHRALVFQIMQESKYN